MQHIPKHITPHNRNWQAGEEFTLTTVKGSWKVVVVFSNGAARFSAGWNGFSEANKLLKKSQNLIFTMVEKEKGITFNVVSMNFCKSLWCFNVLIKRWSMTEIFKIMYVNDVIFNDDFWSCKLLGICIVSELDCYMTNLIITFFIWNEISMLYWLSFTVTLKRITIKSLKML